MKKKTKKRLVHLLWALIGVALAALVFIPPRAYLPRQRWTVPLQKDLPNWSLTPAVRDLMKLAPPLALLPQPFRPEPKPEPPPTERSPTKPPVLLPPPPVSFLRPSPALKGQGARIAIIIDDVGPSEPAFRQALKLPAEVTLSFLPYAKGVRQEALAAREAGHDTMLHLPMEPLGGENPGPDALTTAQDDESLREKLSINLNKFDGYLGVNNHMGSRMTMDRNKIRIVLEGIHEKGLFFVDSRTSARSVAGQVAQELGVSSVSRDVFLDDTPTPAAIRAQLAQAEQIARHKGGAVVIGHPHSVTLQTLTEWIPQAKSAGYAIVPVRQLIAPE